MKFRVLHYSDTHNMLYPTIAAHNLNTTLAPDMFVNTGDCVNDKYGDSISNNSPWNYYYVIGNHDAITSAGAVPPYYDWTKQPTQEQEYNMYMAPLTVDVDIAENTTWWSKYFANHNIMAIGINCTALGDALTAQSTWLDDILTDCLAGNMKVLFFSHMPPSIAIQSGQWTNPTYYAPHNNHFDTAGFEAYYPFIQSSYTKLCNFADSGGKVLGFICGHEHADGISIGGTTAKFPIISVASTVFIPDNGSLIKDKYSDLYRDYNNTNSIKCPVTNLYEIDDDSLVCYRYGAEWAHNGSRRYVFTYDYKSDSYSLVY